MAEQTTRPQSERSATSRPPRSSFGTRSNNAGSRGPGGKPGSGGPRRGAPRRDDRPKSEYEQKTLSIRRVTRVVSGGRRFSFSVVLAIGDKKGTMGIGVGKAGDTTLAIQKAFNDAKKNIIKIRLTDAGTIEHDVAAKYKSARVMLMPNTGRGVVVGSAMRVMVELGGLTDITGRVISGSKNKLNIAQATIKALSKFALPKKARAAADKPVVAE